MTSKAFNTIENSCITDILCYVTYKSVHDYIICTNYSTFLLEY